MARTYRVVNGKLEVTTTIPPEVRLIGKAQLTRRVDQLNTKSSALGNKIVQLQSEKDDIDATATELAGYIGQL
jgi:hypothetical protein